MEKNRKKLLFFAVFSLLTFAKMFAGSNDKGIEYFRAELYDAAKIFFLQQTNQSATEQAENYYYLGHTYYQLNQEDSASYYYKKATEVSPEYPFGYVGLGKLEFKKGNIKAADDLFKKANSYAKKNPAVQTAIAEVYIDAGDYNNAIIALDRARKVNSKYSGIYVAEGDMLMKQGKVGDACGRYDNAIFFDKTDKLAYLKSALFYKGVSISTALDYLDRLVAIDPDYIPAYAIIGEIHKDAGRYQKALDAYEKFISVPGIPMQQYEYYTQLLFFTNQYEKALDQIKYVLSKNPDNLIMKRLEAYNSFRLENYTLGLEQMNNFLEILERERHIYQDYTTLGRLATKEKQPLLALEALQKAIELDSARAATEEIYNEMAAIAVSAGMYPEAVDYYEKHLVIKDSPDANDFNNYAKAAYSAAAYYITPGNFASVTTPEAIAAFESDFKNYVQKSDNAYAEVIKRRPEMYYGYVGRANVNSLLDKYDIDRTEKMQGYAKPFFEEAIQVLLNSNSDGSKNKMIIDAYRYLASYYFAVENNTPAIIEYNKKILDIDPNDEKAKETLKVLKVKY